MPWLAELDTNGTPRILEIRTFPWSAVFLFRGPFKFHNKILCKRVSCSCILVSYPLGIVMQMT
jgi:hypothetical protein